ncbi:efflux transporter, RND family, MFP subunit [Leptospira ryugenii]|uniref:Efflux transporter, RND family, MFP subunit n=1 Tax=Leptospira ryugenii TaxID=1917863 RepID=A0A2P2E5A7_9LEPT|nr:efflux RND transporter periplasmic adaptor subunit [Leptospira ryugenii]GBF52042.1 efflux transporter, RND family, MFP subunit [Leptospira ryugenii]
MSSLQNLNKIRVTCLLLIIMFFSCHKTEDLKHEDHIILIHPEPYIPEESTIFVGQLKPWYEAPLYAQVSGYVKQWYKDYGAVVKKGELLAEIQAPILDAEFAQAKAEWEAQNARYQLADITANRYNSLKSSNAVSEQSVSVAKATQNAEKSTLKASKEQVNKQRVYLNFKQIRAPFDGIVTQRNINVGEYVNKEGNLSESHDQKNLFTIADVRKLRLFVPVPERYVNMLKKGFQVDVEISQFRDRVWKAEFYNFSRGYDPDSQTVLVQFSLINDDLLVWPGSIANVLWPKPTQGSSYSVPTSALVFDESGTRVATITKDHKIHFKSIVVGKLTDRFVEVKSGLELNDKVIQNPKASFLENDIIYDRLDDRTTKKDESNQKQLDHLLGGSLRAI